MKTVYTEHEPKTKIIILKNVPQKFSVQCSIASKCVKEKWQYTKIN